MIELRPYQKKAIEFLVARKKAMLIMSCRTGKSLTSLMAAQKAGYKEVFVLGPANMESTWKNEVDKLPERIKLTYITPLKKYNHSIPEKSCLIIDECQDYMHSYKTQKTVIHLAKKAESCYMLTATPFTNTPINIYWPLRICGFVTNKEKFILRYMGGKRLKSDPTIVYPTRPTNLKELSEIKKNYSFIYHRKENVGIKVKRVGPAPIKGSDNIENYAVFNKLLGLRKADDEKALKALKEGLGRDKKIIVFYRHKQVGKSLFHSLQHRVERVSLVGGHVMLKQREKIINNFGIYGRSILLLSLECGGAGLDIQADKVIFFEKPWSPAKFYQAYMRAYGFQGKVLHVESIVYDDEDRYLIPKEKEILNDI